jgi:hypothetical protein
MKQEAAVKILARVPPDVKTWLEQQARRNWTSQNAELIRAVRSMIESEQP